MANTNISRHLQHKPIISADYELTDAKDGAGDTLLSLSDDKAPESVEAYERLLREFAALPKSDSNPTFMELCQMGGDRFEERCSQVLCFYLNPDAPHGMSGLLLKSLIEAAKSELSYSLMGVKVYTEETTSDNKRIDITVVGNDFVIAIENKINAELYNPLESYVQHIKEKYHEKQQKLFIVLSGRSITDTQEIKKMEQHGYVYVNYSALFDSIKRNFGHYAMHADLNYTTFLFDFIRTIEKRFYNTNMELNKFFFNNSREIDSLITHYESFKNSILQNKKEHIAMLQNKISDLTHHQWQIWQGWDLWTDFNTDTARIGIEGSFNDESIDNPLGYFHIYITVWRKRDFFPYEADLKAAYPNCYIDYEANGSNRVYLHLPRIDGTDTESTLKALEDCYNTLKEIAAKQRP